MIKDNISDSDSAFYLFQINPASSALNISLLKRYLMKQIFYQHIHNHDRSRTIRSRSSKISFLVFKLLGRRGRSKLVEGLELSALAPQNPTFEPPGHSLGPLVLDELFGWHGEDIVQFFERTLLGLGNEVEDHDQRRHVKATV